MNNLQKINYGTHIVIVQYSNGRASVKNPELKP